MNKLYLDIETIPSQHKWIRDDAIDKIKPPGNIKKQETIEKWYAENFEAAAEKEIHNLGLDGATCHIIAIGAAVNDEHPVCMYAENPIEQEKQIIQNFFEFAKDASRPVFVGHNVTGFDMQIIRQRAIVLGLSLPSFIPFDAKPWDRNPFDTLMQWDTKKRISLDKLAKTFGIEGKQGFDGSMVYNAWKNGEHDKIKEYCIHDVILTRAVAKRFFN